MRGMMTVLGGAVFIGGAFLWCGNVFGFFPTLPFVGYLTMLAGGGIFGAGQRGEMEEEE